MDDTTTSAGSINVSFSYVVLRRESILRILAEERRNEQYIITKCNYHPYFRYEGTTEDGHDAFIEHANTTHGRYG